MSDSTSCSFQGCAAQRELVEKVRVFWECRVDVVAAASVGEPELIDESLDAYSAALDELVGFFVVEFSGVDDE